MQTECPVCNEEEGCGACAEGEHELCHDPELVSRPDWETGEVRVVSCCCGEHNRDYDEDRWDDDR